jgi:hypothetical protein
MVLEGFARSEFVMRGRNTRSFAGKTWEATDQNLDFIFERDSLAYGVEVKNALGYMDHDVFEAKTQLSRFLGITPIFAVRMMPTSWINELNKTGGFALVLKYQLYPWTHKELARRVARELGLPVDAPRALEEGTMPFPELAPEKTVIWERNSHLGTGNSLSWLTFVRTPMNT